MIPVLCDNCYGYIMQGLRKDALWRYCGSGVGTVSQRDEVYMLHGVLVQVRPLRAFGIRVTN